MRPLIRRLLVGSLFCAACGDGSSLASGNADGAASNPSSPDSATIASYQALALKVQTGTSDYAASMTSAHLSTQADCQSMLSAYDSQVRPWVQQMLQDASVMDDDMIEHGGAAVADSTCSATRMLAELDYHRAHACASAILAEDVAEAQRHATAMQAFTSHMAQRCSELIAGSHGEGFHWSMMMAGCAADDHVGAGHCVAADASTCLTTHE